MNPLKSLPFKIGDRVETKSFEPGYRGAWFRGEIQRTGKRGVGLKLYDYPEQKLIWMRSLYHKVPSRSVETKKELMMRPQFPPVYNEDEAPDLDTLSEVVVVTTGVWKVGDLVDWFCDGAYWSGTITKFLDDKVELQSPPKPMGENSVYEALSKDLRPSLEWSQNSGWKVPLSKENTNSSYCPCARLIEPVNKEKKTEAAAAKESQTDIVSNTFFNGQAPENEEIREKIKLNTKIPSNSSKCDSIESSIMEIEELLNRVKWMKRMLEPDESANVGWKFQEYRAGGDKPVRD